MRVFLVIAALLLAGCTSDGEEAPTEVATGPAGAVEQLSGNIVDGAVVPIEGATVSIPALGIQAVSDEDGFYSLNDLPYDETLVLIAEAPGFIPSSKSLSLVPDTLARLNFTLEAVPVLEPYYDILSYNGIIACSGVVKDEDTTQRWDCAPDGAPDVKTFEIPISSDAAGVVIEVVWEQQTESARDMYMVAQTVGYGDLDEVLVEQEGSSILRGQVSNAAAERFYSAGGIMRLHVDVGRNVADDESGAGTGFMAQQDYEVFVSVFYVAQPPSSYTIADAG